MLQRYHKKTLPFIPKYERQELTDDEKISLAKCRELLGSEGKYTDTEVLKIRDWFYELAAIAFDEYNDQKETKIIPIVSQHTNHEKSNHLRAG